MLCPLVPPNPILPGPIPLLVLSIPCRPKSSSYFRLDSSTMRPCTVSVASFILVASHGWIPLWVLEGKEDKRPDLSRELHQTPSGGLLLGLQLSAFPDIKQHGQSSYGQPSWINCQKHTWSPAPSSPQHSHLRGAVATSSLHPQLLPLQPICHAAWSGRL